MNKATENLIAALRETFTENDIIKDGATDWQLDNLIDAIAADADNEPSLYDDECIYDTPLWYYTYGGKWSTQEAAEKLEKRICALIDAATPAALETLQDALAEARFAQEVIEDDARAQAAMKQAEEMVAKVA